MRCLLIIILIISGARFTVCAESGRPPVKSKNIYFVKSFDACMDEYYQLTQINEQVYNSAVSYCYTVYQEPYNMLCHGQAILTWSGYQDQIFDYLVMCQNGNYGRLLQSKDKVGD